MLIPRIHKKIPTVMVGIIILHHTSVSFLCHISYILDIGGYDYNSAYLLYQSIYPNRGICEILS